MVNMSPTGDQKKLKLQFGNGIMKFLKEVTKWTEAPGTPNHIYIFNDKNQNVGYIKQGTSEMLMFSKPSKQFDKRRRQFVEVEV
tara:strand:- start:342 stop:593 length:252 start_codon:yes stop_codon:yes gene_type:complete